MKDNIDVEQLKEFRPLVYVASPYSKTFNRYKSFINVCKATAWLLKQDVEAFSPIAHSHSVSMLGGISAVDQDFWLQRCKPYMEISRCMIVVMLYGWRVSNGVQFEIQQFKAMGKPIFHMQWPRPTK